MHDTLTSAARAALLGLAVGDALGVPVEFQSRAARRQDPVEGMRGYGTHGQPAGTWSDDASLAFCLAESLAAGGDVADAAQRFGRWYEENYWTPHGAVFDVGIATAEALRRLKRGVSPTASGGAGEYDNGNGSLMRILPLAFRAQALPMADRFELVRAYSAITHAHIRAVLGCFIYVEMACQLLSGVDKLVAYHAMQFLVRDFLATNQIASEVEIRSYHRILEIPYGDYEPQPLAQCPEAGISSSGYVVHTLEAALWCLLKYDTYAATTLAAVNLRQDTDTTGTVAGGLAGLAYGEAAIPAEWLRVLARRTDIEELATRLAQAELNK
ncbi:MAG: draG3 [Hymenobacter sp.]|nr:draG3 [Hymenobacter sp.]